LNNCSREAGHAYQSQTINEDIMNPMNITDLPFVSIDDDAGTKDLWAVEPAQTWAAGNELGRIYADRLMDYLKRGGAASTLGHVVTAFKNPAGAIECGFLHRIAEYATDGRA
jgi:hypothetical protein